ncbi:GW domain-containing glycosaminoglycan-binding protein [Bacillus sp. C1]
MYKLMQNSKIAIVSTAGVCVLLSTPTYMSADTIKQNDVKVQEGQANVEKQGTDKVNKQEELKPNTSQNEVKPTTPQEGVEIKPKTENKSIEDKKTEGNTPKVNTDKVEVKKENKVEDSTVQNKQEEVKPQTDSLQVSEEEKANTDPTMRQSVMKATDYVQIQENQIIESSNNDGIWSLPYGVQGANYVGSVNTYVGKEVKLIQKAVVDNATWYQFSVDGRTVGWLDSKVLSPLKDIKTINQDATMGATGNNGIWSLPYGVKGANHLGNPDRYAYDGVKLIKEAKSGTILWYQFSVNGKVIGWVDAKALDKGTVNPVNFKVMIGNVSSQHGVWSKPYGVYDAQYVAPVSNYIYQTVQVVKTAKLGNTNWYQVKNNNGIIGWINGDRAVTDMENLPIENSTALVGSSSSADGVWSVPYGEEGANWLSPVSNYYFKQVTVIQKAKKGNTVWSKIKLGDRVLGWVDSKTLSNSVIHGENKTVLLGDTNGHTIWTVPYGQENTKYVAPASNYINKPIKVTGSILLGNTTWYHIYIDGRELGWLDARAISSATNVKYYNGVYHVSNTQGHTVWTRPFGLQNASWVGSASDFTNTNLNVELSINYNNVTWYGFKNQRGQMNWIDSRAVSQGTVFPRMNVPIIKQRDYVNPSRDLPTGCEITAVTMMLQYAGANVDKVQLAYEMPYHPSDPNKGFVGSPWRNGPVSTIYPSALTGLVSKYAGSAVNLTGGNLDNIKDRLKRNHPVVAWVTMHGFGIHAITLTGYNNDRVFYNDPWTGEKDASMSWNDFNNNWTSKKKRALSY